MQLKTIKKFIKAIKGLTIGKKLSIVSLLIASLFYPGQNYYQSLIVRNGEVKGIGVDIPDLPPYPINDGTVAPYISAYSAVVQDANSKTMLLTKNPNTALLPASTTKIMTGLVALDYYKDLSAVITITNEDRAIGHEMGLQEGEQITIESLLYGLLVESGNDAAFALANNYCAPRSSQSEVGSCGYDVFVSAMNSKASKLKLDNTVFKNPSGVEQYGHLTTARDLAVLASYAVKNPTFNKIMQTRKITITDTTGEIIHELESTNELLGKVKGVKGMKTGWTQNAGECLVTYSERGGQSLITVVLNSQDRFGESERLIEWAYDHHTWLKPEI